MKNKQEASVIKWQRLLESTGHSLLYKKKLNGIFIEYTVQLLVIYKTMYMAMQEASAIL